MKQARNPLRGVAAAAIAGVTALAGAAAPAALAHKAHHHHGHHGVKVTVEVLGKPPAYKRIIDRTVTLTATPVAKDGGSCTGMSAAGALQLATKGDWSGTWDAEYSDYEVTRIEGIDLPFKAKAAADWYWQFMVDGKEASAGICGTHAKSGETFLFKPACYGTACPKVEKKRRHRGHGHAHGHRRKR